jgi:hypothetical protein
MAVRLSALRTGLTLLPRNIIFNASDTHFCSRLSKPQGLVLPEGLGKFRNHLIGNRTRDLPVCSIVPQPLRYRVPRYVYRPLVKPVRIL